MVRKAEMLVEKFPNGVTVRLNDASTCQELEKFIAIKGEESSCIGDSIWDDVCDTLSQSESSKVKILVEIQTL